VQNDITVRSVCVGKPAFLMVRDGAKVLSGIVKHPVTASQIVIGRTNIEGDGQADLVNHGGPDKAIYVYPSEHLPWWRETIGYDGGDASFGENLSIAGILETEVCIGDIWQWGEVTLQVSQPRWPCFKLAQRTGHRDMVKRFVDSLRSGWYLRVLKAGTTQIDAPILRVESDARHLTVDRAFRLRKNSARLSAAERNELLSHPHLATGWKSGLE